MRQGLRSLTHLRSAFAFLALVTLLLAFLLLMPSEQKLLGESEADTKHDLVWGYIPDMVDVKRLCELSIKGCFDPLLHFCTMYSRAGVSAEGKLQHPLLNTENLSLLLHMIRSSNDND